MLSRVGKRIITSRITFRMCRSFSSAGNAEKAEKIPISDTKNPSVSSPKLNAIVDSIGSLSLLEVSNLVSMLKERFNIKDIAMPAAVHVAAAPGASGAAPAAEAAPVEEKKEEKTEFNLTLEKIDPANKAKVIREVKNIVPGLNLVQAKNFVENLPKLLKEDVKKEEAETLKKTFEQLGAVLKIE